MHYWIMFEIKFVDFNELHILYCEQFFFLYVEPFPGGKKKFDLSLMWSRGDSRWIWIEIKIFVKQLLVWLQVLSLVEID
jgi:hypothetical protein